MNSNIDREKEWKKGLSYLYQVDPTIRKWFNKGEKIEVSQLKNKVLSQSRGLFSLADS